MSQAATQTTQGTPAAQRMTTGEAAVASLIANGINHVFCLPGVQNDYLFDALHRAQDRILRGALRTVLKADGPIVIEVPAGPMPDPWRILRLPRNRPTKAS